MHILNFFLAQRFVRSVSLEELNWGSDSKGHSQDGWMDGWKFAWPILRQHGREGEWFSHSLFHLFFLSNSTPKISSLPKFLVFYYARPGVLILIHVKTVWLVIGLYIWQISSDVQLQIQKPTWCFQKQKWISIVTYKFSCLKVPPQFVTCLEVRVILISNVSIDVWFFFYVVNRPMSCTTMTPIPLRATK